MRAARKHGVVVSYDLNYRDSLWKSFGGKKHAQKVNRGLSAASRLDLLHWRKRMQPQTKTFPDLVMVPHDKGKQSEPESGLKRRVLAYNDKLFVAEHEMVKGWVGKVHSHPHDQVVYVVHGHLRVTCQGTAFDIQAGDTFVVRGGVEHGASAIEDSLVIDVFTPCREDYIA
jgi:quercetin dioxygenase-like cupin family protein